ncbi:hypothetical protein [Streptomyces shaanxiensis]
MPLFRRAVWPRDHRDELVAGALVGAVVIVLGYASGIGAPGAAEAAVPPAVAPTTTAPATVPTSAPEAGQVPVGSGELPAYGGGYADLGNGGGGLMPGTVPVDQAGGPTGGPGGGHDHGGSGHESPPPAATPTPTPVPTPTPTSTDTCEDGEVTLVQPLLVGLTEPVLGLLGTASASPSPTPSPCVGLAPVSSLLGGVLATTPQPEATP